MYYKNNTLRNIIVKYKRFFCQHIIDIECEVCGMKNESLRIKRRGEDGTKIISVRIREDILADLDKIAAESNYSRNELINLILSYGVKNIEIE